MSGEKPWRSGGLRGGPARAAKLSPERRSEIARRAARARWDNDLGEPVKQYNKRGGIPTADEAMLDESGPVPPCSKEHR